jgi:hypothetical protein
MIVADEECLRRLLRTDSLPVSLIEEVELRTQMFHRSGGSGPIGPLACIDAIRFLGMKPTLDVVAAEQVDWRKVPMNGTVRVEAKFFGQWMPGVFRGFSDAGKLAIKMDDDEVVRECRKDMVRLRVEESPKSVDELDARGKLIMKQLESVEEAPVATQEEPEQGEVQAPNLLPFNWDAAKKGDEVWVEVDGEMYTGKFVSHDDGLATVRLNGEKKNRTVALSQVQYGEMVS